MEAAGNDYVVVPEGELPPGAPLPEIARRVSRRRTGVGGDGLIVVRPQPGADGRMEMYNSDGSRSAMCGNGLRQVALFLVLRPDKGPASAPGGSVDLRVASDSGLHYARVGLEGSRRAQVSIEVGTPRLEASAVPLRAAAESRNGILHIPTDGGPGFALSMGNPHCVLFVEDVDAAPVASLGPKLEFDPRFPDRTNVEFVQIIDRGRMRERTWERGAGETDSCGSGACASVVAAALLGRTDRRVLVEQRGGAVEVRWNPSGVVELAGPVSIAFSGVWEANAT